MISTELVRQYLWPYVLSNAVALGLLAASLWRPRLTRYAFVLVFAAAGAFNAFTAIRDAGAYLMYGDMTPWGAYRSFITGIFADHTALFVLAIALGQLVVATLLAMIRPWRLIGVAGAALFLIAIAPLGVGSAFPATLVMALAVLLAVVGEGRETARGAVRRRVVRA